MLAWFDFVATEVFLGLSLLRIGAFNWAILIQFDFVGCVYRVFGRVIMALATGLAD